LTLIRRKFYDVAEVGLGGFHPFGNAVKTNSEDNYSRM